MKKLLVLLLALALCLSMVACGGGDDEPEEAAEEAPAEEVTEEEEAEKPAEPAEEAEEVTEEEELVEEIGEGPEEVSEDEILDYEFYVDIEKGLTLYFDDIYVHELDGTQYLVVVSRFVNESETESFEPIDVLVIDAYQTADSLEYVAGIDGISDDDGYMEGGEFAVVEPGETSGPLYDIFILEDESPVTLEFGGYDNYLENDEYFYTTLTDLPIK